SRRLRLRRRRPQDPGDAHRALRRRTGGPQGARRGCGRGQRHDRGPLRAVPDPGGLPPAHAARPGGHPPRLPAPPLSAPARHHRQPVLTRLPDRLPVRRAALIYNPTSGRRKHAQVLDPVLATLRGGGFAVEPAPTSYAGEATVLARGLAADGCEAVFSLGGDGTAREVAAGLLGTPTALGFLPGGTANVLTLG